MGDFAKYGRVHSWVTSWHLSTSSAVASASKVVFAVDGHAPTAGLDGHRLEDIEVVVHVGSLLFVEINRRSARSPLAVVGADITTSLLGPPSVATLPDPIALRVEPLCEALLLGGLRKLFKLHVPSLYDGR